MIYVHQVNERCIYQEQYMIPIYDTYSSLEVLLKDNSALFLEPS